MNLTQEETKKSTRRQRKNNSNSATKQDKEHTLIGKKRKRKFNDFYIPIKVYINYCSAHLNLLPH